jgi:uncharacterized protein YgbK (DUF1537 family)
VSDGGSTARAEIRALRAERGDRVVVLDDDPTGSQCVHGVTVVTAVDAAQIAQGLSEPGATCFVLTNTRSLGEAAAVELTTKAALVAHAVAGEGGFDVELVSRSDSTLRGHVLAEVRALDAVRRRLTGQGYDGVLLVPAFFEAGRRTVDDVHWVRSGEDWVPAAETEFARDSSFGYSSSNLRAFVAERSGGAIAADEVASIGLDDVRAGRERVAARLREVRDGAFVVVNATGYEDLEVVVLGLLDAQADGSSFLYRTGPSFVRALAGLEPRDPVTADELGSGERAGHGLVIVGSHVGLTSRQVAEARALGGLEEVEVDVGRAGDAGYVEELAGRVAAELARSDVLVITSRTLRRGADAEESLQIAREVSSALARIARGARAARPAWVVAKGGITSHDIAARGLEIRRAEVIGQMQPGIVSVFRPLDAAPEAIGVPYVVFAGNVGDESTLASVIDRLRGGS